MEFEEPNTEAWVASQEFQIWGEGYAANEGRSGAIFLGTFAGRTFDEAVQARINSDPTEAHLYRKTDGKWYYWGCQLFPTCAQAAASFG